MNVLMATTKIPQILIVLNVMIDVNCVMDRPRTIVIRVTLSIISNYIRMNQVPIVHVDSSTGFSRAQKNVKVA